MCTHNWLAFLTIRASKFILWLCLNLVFEELKRPDNPESSRSHASCREKLSKFGVHKRCVSSAKIQHANETSKKTNVAREYNTKAFINFWVQPSLIGLAFHFRVLKRALNNRSEYSSTHAAGQCAQLYSPRSRYRRHHELVSLKFGIEKLSYCKLRRSVQNGAKKWR